MSSPSDLDQVNARIIQCRKCPRLVQWREEVARLKRKAYQDWKYWGKPVPGFGDHKAQVLVVGLAPGAHGSNRTGRQFTGDASGSFLYPALHRAGFASQSYSENRQDGLRLFNLYLTASARCAPPGNKPTLEELNNCQPYLEREIEILDPRVIVCLGRVAFERVLRIVRRKTKDGSALSPSALPRISPVPFAHGAVYKLTSNTLNPAKSPQEDHWILCSYHPSQQNTLTGKLTVKMFDDIWVKARSLLEGE